MSSSHIRASVATLWKKFEFLFWLGWGYWGRWLIEPLEANFSFFPGCCANDFLVSWWKLQCLSSLLGSYSQLTAAAATAVPKRDPNGDEVYRSLKESWKDFVCWIPNSSSKECKQPQQRGKRTKERNEEKDFLNVVVEEEHIHTVDANGGKKSHLTNLPAHFQRLWKKNIFEISRQKSAKEMILFGAIFIQCEYTEKSGPEYNALSQSYSLLAESLLLLSSVIFHLL